MKRSLLQHEKHNILPEYGKKRLILYADTLQEIAGSFEEETAPARILNKFSEDEIRLVHLKFISENGN